MSKIGIFSTDLKPSNELYIFECGFEHCAPRDPYQYEQIDYYLIHYIVEGEGLFFIKDQVHHLKAGDGFIIPPYTDNNYYPTHENPWVYKWIGINGSKAKELLSSCGFLLNDNYTFNYTKDNTLNTLFENIYNSCSSNKLFEALGYLYQTLSKLMCEHTSLYTEDTSPQGYLELAIEFIEQNYNKNISVSDISDYLNIDRSHFYKIFKLHMMNTPQQYLIEFKLKKACDLLRKSSYSICEISSLSGFASQSYFSKVFKKNITMTPIEYRNLFIK